MRRFGLIILASLFLAVPASAQSTWVPWAAAGWSQQGVQLSRVVENWPLLEGLSGTGSLSVGIRPAADGGSARELWLHFPEARFGELVLGTMDIAVTEPFDASPSTVRVQVLGPVAGLARAELTLPATVELLTGEVKWKPGAIDGQVLLRAVDLDAVTHAFPVLALGGKVDVSLDLGGTGKNLSLDGTIDGAALSWRSDPIGRVVATLNHVDKVSKLTAEWGPRGKPIADLSASIPLDISLPRWDVTWLDKEPHELKLGARGLTPEILRPFWRAPRGADFALDIFAGGFGTLDDFGINATMAGRLIDPGRPWLPVYAQYHIAPKRQKGSLTLGEDLLAAEWMTEADLVRIRRRNGTFETARVYGTAGLKLPLVRVSPYVPDSVHDLTGLLTGALKVTGTLGAPDFDGSFSTADGGVTLVDANLRLRELQFAGSFDDTTLTISDLSASAGLGRIGGSGRITLVPTPDGHKVEDGLWADWEMTGEFDGQLERFPFIHDSFPNGLIDAGFRAELAAGPGDTQVDVTVRDGMVALSEARILPEAAAIPENRGVRLIDWRGDVEDARSFMEGDGRLRATLTLENPVKVRGETTQIDLTGAIAVDRQDRLVAVEGGFAPARGGKFDLFENEFVVLHGNLTMLGGDLDDREALASAYAGLADPDAASPAVPLEPVIDFTARGYAVDTHVLLQVKGPVRRPELVLASSPALPEYQILTLLITGKVDAVDEKNGNVRKKVAKLVATFHNPSLSRQLYDRIGLDKIGLGFGKSVAQPVLTVGKQVSRQLYVETVYHHDAPPEENEKEARVNYLLNPYWTLDTAFGDAGIGSFGLFWMTRWGGPPRPEPPADWGVTGKK